MANAIIAAATYRLSWREKMTIHMQAPSWRNGPGMSELSNALIESQRQKFISANRGDGINDVSETLNLPQEERT